jgi:hypothetical protein
MAPLRPELRQVLLSALEKRRRDDTIEQALGREARRAGLSYADYLEVAEAVRERARKDRNEAWEAAKALSKEQ